MTDRELMQQALEALEVSTDWDMGATGKQAQSMRAITALRERLAQPERGFAASLAHNALPSREWQGLTDEEIWRYWWDRPEVPDGEDDSMEAQFVSAVRAIEAKLKEKNT